MTKQINVLQVIGAKNAGGAETYAMRLIQAQHEDERFNVTCIARKGSWAEKELRSKGIPTMAAPFSKHFDFRTGPIIKNAVEALQIDVVQGSMSRGCSRIPALNVPVLGRMGNYYNLKNFTTCHVVAGDTPRICDYLLENDLRENEVTHLPKFTEDDVSKQSDREEIRNLLSIPEDAPTAIFAGRLHPVKGLDTGIAALKGVENLHLIVLGEGDEESALKQQAKDLDIEDRVHFLGWKVGISKYAAAADIWLIPSRDEPFGNVVLDGWMHKKPVVSSRSHGPEFLIEDHVSGLLVDIDDVDGFTKALQEVVSDKELVAKMVKNGHKRIEETYSKEAVLSAYERVYTEMMENKGFLNGSQYKRKNG